MVNAVKPALEIPSRSTVSLTYGEFANRRIIVNVMSRKSHAAIRVVALHPG